MKKVLLGLILFSIIALLLGTTYSWLTWNSSNDSIMNITIGNVINYEYKITKEINTNALAPVLNYKDGEVLEFSLNKYIENNKKVNVYLYINNIDNELKNISFQYVLEKEGIVVGKGTFENTDSNEKLYILTNEEIYLKKSNYKLYVFIDGNIENNNNMMNKNFNGLLNIEITREENKNEN